VQRGVAGSVEVLAVAGCGHSPHREHPDQVAMVMAEFIRRSLGRG
jgi:pimeloyl-ACP methyl ester carboxylesterase